jgi:EmrB/QacA subfamily drug resistance transporter
MKPDSIAAPIPVTFCPVERRPIVLVAAILASSMGFIDGSVVALAMPAIRADIGGSLVDAQWITNAYMLFLSSLVLIGGASGDVFGVRNIFAGGVAVFMAASLLCALSPDISILIGIRALQGVGAAFMVPGSLAIIAKAYPAEARGAAIGTWAAFSSLTTAMGPVLGGIVLSLGPAWTWRVIFAINVPAGLVVLALLFFRVPLDRPGPGRRLDIPGAVLATLGLGFFSWGLTAFGLPAGKRQLPPFLWLATGGAAFVGFIVRERFARSPMVKLALFRSRAFSGANLYTLVLFFGFNAVLFFLPMTVVSAWRVPEWKASLLFLPVSVCIATFSRWSGRAADRTGPRLFLTAGSLLVALAYAGLALTMPLMRLWSVTLPLMMIGGVGMALLVSPLSSAVMNTVPDTDTGLASGVNNAVARAAGLMAIAALGAAAALVFKGMMGASAATVSFGVLPGKLLDDATETARVAATNSAFATVAAIASAACLLAALIAWFSQPSRKTCGADDNTPMA